jgi:hypothetical protein
MKMMKAKWLWGGIIAFFSLSWGMLIWLNGRFYTPPEPVLLPARHVLSVKAEPIAPFGRYATLAGGGMFFGNTEKGNGAPPVVPFHTNLVLLGIVKGSPSTAVLATCAGAKSDTQIVKVGDRAWEERVTAIGETYVTIRNHTGEGRIYIPD